MRALKAHVKSGRIVVDEPTDLPEGTELELVPLVDEHEMTPEERAQLDAMIEESGRELDVGLGMSVERFWAEFRANRRQGAAT